MKIKRYFAPDIRQAIRMVRDEQGPDAVILSNRKVAGGVEIVAARDFDEQEVLERRHPEKRDHDPRLQARPEATPPGFSSPVSAPRADTHTDMETRRMMSETRRRAEDAFQEALGRFAANGEYRFPPEPEIPKPAPFCRVKPQTQPPLSESPRIDGTAARPFVREGEDTSKPSPARDRNREGGYLSSREIREESGEGESLSAMRLDLRQMRRMLDIHFVESRWQAAASRAPTQLDLLRRLGALGFSRHLSQPLAERAGVREDLEHAWNHMLDLVAMQIPLADEGLLDYGGVVALVGPTGVGKTTTIAKLAARFRLKHGPRQVALITLDNFRIGAHEQLNTYGRILDVPVRAASCTEELHHLLAGFQDRRLVLIDTAGMGQRDARLGEQMELFRRVDASLRSYLVLSAAGQERALKEAIAAFDGYAPHACILTKLDETAQMGMAISAVVEKRLPVAFLCDGQQVPEDLHVAKTQLLLNRCAVEVPEEEARDRYPFTPMEWAAHANF